MSLGLFHTYVTQFDEFWLTFLNFGSYDRVSRCNVWPAISSKPSNLTVACLDLLHHVVRQFLRTGQETTRGVNRLHVFVGIVVHVPNEAKIFELSDPSTANKRPGITFVDNALPLAKVVCSVEFLHKFLLSFVPTFQDVIDLNKNDTFILHLAGIGRRENHGTFLIRVSHIPQACQVGYQGLSKPTGSRDESVDFRLTH